MAQRIVNIAKEVNRPIKDLVVFLSQYGFTITPTAMVPDEMAGLIYQHFKSDINFIDNIPHHKKPVPPKKDLRSATVWKVALYYNVLIGEILAFLDSDTSLHMNLNSRLDKFQLEEVDKNFGNERTRKNPVTWIDIKVHPYLKSADSKIIQTSISSPIKQIQLDRDIFNHEREEIIFRGLKSFRSYFSDTEAIKLCSRMSSSYARNLCLKYLKEEIKSEKELLRYQIHYVVNKALKTFGGKILTLIFELPKLGFRSKTAEEVRTYNQVRPDFPLISFKTSPQVNIAFFTKRKGHTNELIADVRLFNDKSYKEIGYINRDGYIKLKLESFRPQLAIFLQKVNEGKYQIYSGVETGICDICKRPLTHPNSLRIGIGPVCAKNINLDPYFYQSD